ncbi:putative transcriptional regulator [hydrocarbon metagenome]|uniref:Putative transcriptional regulator n=1 Tax=hydrocarbon metagenome TaxID=938273 RepID=A0A0W8E2S9_9ZZZZ
MTFADKLDLLMNITKTSNSMLARNISLDASFISRLRRGVRTPVENASYISAMARYFARNCNSEYQKAALAEAIKTSSQIKPHQSETMADFVCKWLLEPTRTQNNSIVQFLEEVSNAQFKKPALAVPDVAAIDTGLLGEEEILLGVEGKRAAVLKFLWLVLQNKSPQTLLLYSNEDLGWLSDDPEFFAKWGALMFQVLKNGNRIKIIHTLNRNLDEMLSGIKGWVPIYMTGAIEPYYCPKTRDGIFRRTLFIAPETAAVTSSSVRTNTKNTANLLFTRKEAVQAMLEEYHDFLALCRPLMRIFTPFNQGNYLETLAEFEDEKCNAILKTDTLSYITIPSQAAISMITRSQEPTTQYLLSVYQDRIDHFHTLLEKYRHTEIFPLPDLEAVLSGKVEINFSDMSGQKPMFYAPGEYHQHLQNIIHLLKTFENYHVHLAIDKQLQGSMVYVKDDVGVIVGKTSPSSVIFAINESNMTAAFWDYMNMLLGEKSHGITNRNRTIAELEAISSRLEATMA